MSARELHRFCRDSGKRRLSFKDIKPFVDKKQLLLINSAQLLAQDIAKRRKNGEGLPKEAIHIIGMLQQAGVLIHPLNLMTCFRLETQELNVTGVPFHVYFHTLGGPGRIGGTFMDTDDKHSSSVFLSLNTAIHMISSYLASNNLKALEVQRVGWEFLLKRYKEGSLDAIERGQLIEISHQLLGTRLFELEINRLFNEESVEQYVELIEKCLNGIALHEAAHVLHKSAGVLGRGGIEKEEKRAYLTELAYGNPSLVLPYLPIRKKDDHNCKAALAILEQIFSRYDYARFMNMDKQQLSTAAKELLDEDFVDCFGKHHDQIISRLEIERVRQHRFFSEKDLPMFEGLRYLPRTKVA
jgi:hypothetical protein